MKFVLATQNPKKKEELAAILGDLGVEIVTEEELGVKVEVEETGNTFGENAALKAKAVMEATGLPAIGDDSGLCVDAMKGAPGVYSARYGGEELSDEERCALVLEMMHGQTDRAAHFETYIVCAFPNGDWFAAKGECHGAIAFAPMGKNGFGYDPIFFRTEEQKTFGQMTAEEKAAISHRGNALRSFKTKLEKYLREHPEA
ncbi:MAG: RdgB/HAM1 family non-canonical purine NTP pyrophosphatase [Ruminococcaceae bacterium]|jgi:XTP/dITP diphosphohydrolase|nr:RdgB/HAM1 family non-canonical purine NTP pyrophosphatase [Oscillospiraceae bacterium]